MHNDFMDKDLAIRLAALNWLSEQTSMHGEVLPWSLLFEGFEYEGKIYSLVSRQGIVKPAGMEISLSFYTSPTGAGTAGKSITMTLSICASGKAVGLAS